MKSATGWTLTHDIEGCYAFERIAGHPSFGYSLAFRTGCIEVVQNFIGSPLEKKLIPNPGFETDLVRFFPQCIRWLQAGEVQPPIVVALSLLDVKEFVLYFDAARQPHPLRSIRHRDLVVPDVVMESFDQSPASIFRPMFDTIWNACGLQRSFNFDSTGQFKPQLQ